jgi:hypothetical protein
MPKVNEPSKAVELFHARQHNILGAVPIWQRGSVGFAAGVPRTPHGAVGVSTANVAPGAQTLFRGCLTGGRTESALDVIDDNFFEIGGHRRAAQCHGLFAVDKNRRSRLLAGARQ